MNPVWRGLAPATLLLLPFLALLLLSGPGSAGDDSIVEMEHFLPATANLYLSLPNGKTAEEILARLDLAPGHLKDLIRVADGPITVSRHSVRLPAEPPVDDAILVSLSRRRDRDELSKAALSWVRAVLAPGAKAVSERISGRPVSRFDGKRGRIWVGSADRYVFVATNAFVLGRVFRAIGGASSPSLVRRPDFAEAKTLRSRHGAGCLLWGRGAALPAVLRTLGVLRFAGMIPAVGARFREELVVVPERGGRLTRLVAKGAVPGAWAEAEPDGIWIGASLAPRGVLETAMAILDREHLLAAMGIDGVAAGPMEFLWRPGRRPAIAFRVREGADPDRVLLPLGNRAAVRSDGAIVVGEDLATWADRMKVTEAEAPARPGGAWLTGRVATLLAMFGRKDVQGERRTTWIVKPGGGNVTVTSGPSDVGPVQIALGALLP